MSAETPDKAAPDAEPAIRQATYGRNFSYFSHRIFVTYFPEELHDYLTQLFTLDPEAGDATAVTQEQNDTDRLEIELVRWVLLHRSQLNPLALNRLIEAWRGPNQELRIPVAGGVRSDHECRVDITIQFALELELASAREHWLLQTRPRLQMALLDAAYFVTRQWMEFNRPERAGQPADFGEPGREEEYPVLDLSSQEQFRGYLVHRMNLLEDKDPAQEMSKDAESQAGTAANSSPEDKPRSPAEPSPLNEPEFKWLFSIVLGIANTLSTATSKDEVKRRWLQVEKSRRSTLPPAAALYDALLTEKDKTVLIESEDGSLRYRWRPAPDRGAMATDPRAIAARTSNLRKRITFAAETLRRAMTSADGVAPAVHPLRTLADRYHVLPTTPAWERVETALSDLRAAQEEGLGNPQALALDDDVVRQYDALLSSEHAASAVVHLMIMGAALAGMMPRSSGTASSSPANAADRPDSVAWEVGLQAVSDGLLLDSSTLLVTEQRLLNAYAELGALLTLAPYPRTAGGTGGWPQRQAFETAIAAAFAAGQQSHHDQPTEATLADKGWQALQTRLSALAQDAAAAPLAQAVEMVCSVRAIGPGASMPQRLDRAGYRAWTKLLIAALKPASWLRLTSKPPEVPAPVIAHIAERLGIRAWSPMAQEAWIESLHVAKDRREALHNYIAQEGLWRGTPRATASGNAGPGRLALVLGPTGDAPSITEGWPQPPQGGLVLAATASDLDDLQTIGLDRWLRDMHPPLVVAWEPGMETSADHPALRRTVNKLAGGMGPVEVWLYRASQAGTQTPRRIDPATAEELWVDFSAPS